MWGADLAGPAMTIYHNGPIEEYQVRDCTTGEDETFRDFDTACKTFEAWHADRPNHPIMLIAVIDSI